MAWIVLTVIFGITFWGGILAYLAGRHEPVSNGFKWGGMATAIASAVIWVGVTALLSVHNVGERQVAVVYNFSGTIAGKRDPGVVWVWPYQHVTKENVGIQHVEFDLDEGNSAVSKDQQAVRARLAVNYRVDADEIVDLYKRVGPSWKEIIVNARVLQDFKEVTATFNTPAITAERAKLRTATRDRLSDELKPYDIEVIDVFVTNLGFSKTYMDAVEAKQKQVQDAQRAQARVAEKQAEADQARAEAQGVADAEVIKAEGNAKANRLKRQTLTPLLVQSQAIDKLNDKVQLIVCPPGSVCVPNAGAFPVPSQQG